MRRFSRGAATTAERKADVAHLAALLDRVLRSMSDPERDLFERECRSLDVDPATEVSLLTRTLVAISDVLRATIGPWDGHVIRRFGIVCRPDGFPIMPPWLMPGEVLGALVDELEHIAIPTEQHSVHDHDGDEQEVLGPASDSEVGFVSIARLRAWRKISLSKIKKEAVADSCLSTDWSEVWPRLSLSMCACRPFLTRSARWRQEC